MTRESRQYKHQCGVFYVAAALIGLLISVQPALAQQEAASTNKATPWTHQNYADQNEEFQFAIVSDNAANPREGVFLAALGKLQLLRPEFVLSVGDFIHGYDKQMKPQTDEAVVRKKRKDFDQGLQTLTMPFYRVAGNHDINNDLSAGIWHELYGPDYYSFTYKGALFLCLNSQGGDNYRTGLGKQQIAWVKDTLAKNASARWVFLFFHQPLWLEDEKRLAQAKEKNTTAQLTGFQEIETMLEDRHYTVFAGHHHRYGKWIKNENKYFRLATTGGQSNLAGPEAGQFDHVMWVTMTTDGPIVCNLLLDGILDEDAKRNMPATPDQKGK